MIQEMKVRNNNFSKDTLRWENVFIQNKHVSEVNFNLLNDDDLIVAFVMLVTRYARQM